MGNKTNSPEGRKKVSAPTNEQQNKTICLPRKHQRVLKNSFNTSLWVPDGKRICVVVFVDSERPQYSKKNI